MKQLNRLLFTGAFALAALTVVHAQPNTWVRSENLNGPARHDALGFAIGDKVYTCLGLNMDGDTLTDLWEYDPANSTWTAKAAFPGTPRVGAVTFTIGNVAYVTTGGTVNDTLNDLWAYDPVSDAWTQKADLPGSARTRAGTFAVGALGYVFAGIGPPLQDENGYDMYPSLGDLWAYDPVPDSWVQRADLFTGFIGSDPPIYRSCGFTLGGNGYATRGNAVDSYDPPTNSWTTKADIDPDLFFDPHQDYIGFSLGGHGYLTNMGRGSSGSWSQTHPNKLLRYDPVADTWILAGYFPGLARDEVAFARIGSVVYIISGAHYWRTWFNPDPEAEPFSLEDHRVDLGEVWMYDIRDCQGIPDGTTVPGGPCNDGNLGTYGDVYDLQCTCTGVSQPMQPFHPDQVDNSFITGTGFDGEVQALLLQPDGKILAAGAFNTFNDTACNGIARLNTDGSLDGTFNGALGGRALALQPDGRILVGGNGITRLMPDGSLDPSYDTYLSDIGILPVNALALRPDGRIIAGGSFGLVDEFGTNQTPGLMQLMPNGSQDASFVPDLILVQATVQVLLLRPNGRVLVGMANAYAGDPAGYNLAELQADGSISMPFNGNIRRSFLEPVNALQLRPNGELVVGGEFLLFNDEPWFSDGIPRKNIALLAADGTLSAAFDPSTSTDGFIRALAIGPQGQIIAGGDFTNYRYALHSGIVQLNDYGYADASFQSGTGFNGGVRAFSLQTDGQLIVGGAFTAYNGTVCGRITRLRTPPIGDCEGVAGGGALPGTACNDCDPTTFNDVYDVNCVCAGITTTGPAYQAGSLDPTFDPGSGFTGGAGSMALQPDGKVIVSGGFTAFNGTTKNRIARINADGSLDAGYATGTGFNDRTIDVALQPNGKVLVSGDFTSFNNAPRDLVVRLNANGSLDASFNPGTDHNATSTNKLALQPDGKVLVGGGFLNFNGSDVYDLLRLNANGSFDPTHDIGLGFDFPSDLNGDPTDMVIQPDGKVIVVGGFLWYDGLSPFVGTICRGIARLDPNGALDYSFEHGGSYSDPDDGFTGVPLVIALQPDGRILVGGDFTSYETVARNRIIRLNADGTVDPTFDPGNGFNDEVLAMVLQPDGKILVGGAFTSFNGALRERIARLNPDGSLDATFQPCAGFNASVKDLVLQPDGRLLACGNFTSYAGVARNRIARLFTVDATCIASQLTTTADPVISCGATNLKFNGTSTIAATEVPGANKYQFRFTNITGQPAYSRNIAWPTRSFTLTKWTTNPLKAGRTYNVLVRASFDNGTTWCDWGPSCTVKVSWTPFAPGTQPRDMETMNSLEPELHLYPNPNNGDQLRISLNGTDPDLTTVALEITDLFGKRVMTSTLALQDGEMNALLPLRNDLADGLYIVTITAGERVFNERLVITQ